MVEIEGGGVSFVDFRFVPFLSEEEEGDDEEMQSQDEDEYGDGEMEDA